MYTTLFLIALIASSTLANDGIYMQDLGPYTDPDDPLDTKDNRPEEQGGKFEGDIDIPDPTNRNAMSERTARRWPSRQLVYSISNSFNSQAKSTIRASMDEIQRRTAVNGKSCITFKQRTRENAYVDIKPIRGCYSAAGYTGRRQDLSLGRGCEYKGVIMHELIHALGFFHEQSRADRDSYVNVYYQNIKQGMSSQFRKMSLREVQHLTNYDYDSIMHYGKYAFSANRQPTIIAKNGASIGQRDHLSVSDIKELQLFYKCTAGGSKPVTSRPVVTSKPRPVVTSKPVGPKPTSGGISCNFDSSMCGWIQDHSDQLDWTMRSGKTPSGYTGPTADRSGRGRYIYLEATQNFNKIGRLVSPHLVGGQTYCLNFWYHMYGAHMGYLRFLIGQNGRIVGGLRNYLKGNSGNFWRQFRIQVGVPVRGNFNFIMEGRIGPSYQSDIAVDDINIKLGRC